MLFYLYKSMDMILVKAHIVYCIVMKKHYHSISKKSYKALFEFTFSFWSKNNGRPLCSVNSQKHMPEDIRKNTKGRYLERIMDGEKKFGNMYKAWYWITNRLFYSMLLKKYYKFFYMQRTVIPKWESIFVFHIVKFVALCFCLDAKI